MRTYTQLTQAQRYQISALLKTEHSQVQIAVEIGVNTATISRELRRNVGQRGYRPKQAHRKAKQRRRKSARTRITAETWTRIAEKLRQDWSPEQVSGWLKKHTATPVSHAWIYQYIYANKRAGGDLYTHLRCQKKRRNRAGDYDRRGKIPNQVSIAERPAIVDQRARIGDWKADTIIGAGQRGAIVTLVERKSRLTLLQPVTRRTAAAVEAAILDLLRPHQACTHTITFDNGKEFANHQTIAQKLHAQVFFAHPYASWERGTNENTNGLIRQFFPKGADFSAITDEQIAFVKERLNHRPRKCLDYQAPIMVFSQSQSGCT